MARRRFLGWLRRRPPEPVEEEPVPGSAPRVDPSAIIERYVDARPLGDATAPLPSQPTPPPRAPRLRMPPTASSAGDLPSDGTAALADVVLPAGGCRGARGATLWVTAEPLEDPRPLWRSLAAAFSRTGLWPVMLEQAPPDATDATDATGAWVDELASAALIVPDGPDAVTGHLARALRPWAAELTPQLATSDPVYHAELASLLGTAVAAGGELAQPSGRRLDAVAAAGAALGHTPLALVGCERPAQLPTRVSWAAAGPALEPAALAGVLASWEERYGALLIGLGPDALTLVVTRPPADLVEAREAAAEQLAACPALASGWRGFEAHAASLVDAPSWRLAWPAGAVR